MNLLPRFSTFTVAVGRKATKRPEDKRYGNWLELIEE
jgi:hypothetical protein